MNTNDTIDLAQVHEIYVNSKMVTSLQLGGVTCWKRGSLTLARSILSNTENGGYRITCTFTDCDVPDKKAYIRPNSTSSYTEITEAQVKSGTYSLDYPGSWTDYSVADVIVGNSISYPAVSGSFNYSATKGQYSITKGEGVDKLYVKVGSSSWTEVTTTQVTEDVAPGGTFRLYTTALTGYSTQWSESQPKVWTDTAQDDYIAFTATANINSYPLVLTKGTGIDTIYYKVGTGAWTSGSGTINIPYNSTVYMYATASSGYTYTTYTESNPLTITMGTSGYTYNPVATVAGYSVTITRSDKVSTIHWSGAKSGTSTASSVTVSGIAAGSSIQVWGTCSDGYYHANYNTGSKLTVSSATTVSLTSSLNNIQIAYYGNVIYSPSTVQVYGGWGCGTQTLTGGVYFFIPYSGTNTYYMRVYVSEGSSQSVTFYKSELQYPRNMATSSAIYDSITEDNRFVGSLGYYYGDVRTEFYTTYKRYVGYKCSGMLYDTDDSALKKSTRWYDPEEEEQAGYISGTATTYTFYN